MSEIRVRRATVDDWETIVEYNRRLAEETENKQLHPDTIRQGVRAVLHDSQKGRYFVAYLDDGRIVGQMMHTLEWSDWRNGDIWWLQSVYVAPDYRRKGVFRLLYEHIRKEAEADSQVAGLRLYVEQENRRAYQTYCRMGMSEAGYLVMEQLFD